MIKRSTSKKKLTISTDDPQVQVQYLGCAKVYPDKSENCNFTDDAVCLLWRKHMDQNNVTRISTGHRRKYKNAKKSANNGDNELRRQPLPWLLIMSKHGISLTGNLQGHNDNIEETSFSDTLSLNDSTITSESGSKAMNKLNSSCDDKINTFETKLFFSVNEILFCKAERAPDNAFSWVEGCKTEGEQILRRSIA